MTELSILNDHRTRGVLGKLTVGTQPILFGTIFVCKAIEFHGVSLRIIGGRSEAVHRRGEVTNGGFRYRI